MVQKFSFANPLNKSFGLLSRLHWLKALDGSPIGLRSLFWRSLLKCHHG